MKSIVFILIFMGLSSFLGFGKESKTSKCNTLSKQDTLVKITQPQLDELYQLSLYGIDLVKNELILQGTFLPIGFSYSKNSEFKMLVYDEPSKDGKLLTDYVYEKMTKILEDEFINDSIRITCIIYNGILKNENYQNGKDCISLLFRCKEIDDLVLSSFPIKIVNGEILFGDTIVQMIKK